MITKFCADTIFAPILYGLCSLFQLN
jgi:hypothetical protein